MTNESMAPVDNAPLRDAVAAFAAAPQQDTYLDVVRNCLQGTLLLDSTGSDRPVQLEGGGYGYQPGAVLQFAGGAGPDGKRALFAFTSQEQVVRMHPDSPSEVQSFVQQATAVLELITGDEQYGWLYIDPAGPTCAITNADAAFALRGDRNDAVKAALALPEEADRRAAVIDALRQEGTLLLAIDSASVPDDGVADGAPVRIRTSVGPAGETMLLAFTSGPEVSARNVDDVFASRPAKEVVRNALDPAYAGLVINPSGPWIALSRAELEGIAAG